MPLKRKASEAAEMGKGVRALLDERTAEALGFLLEVMHDENVKTELRMKAAESILDRAWGKSAAAAGGTAAPPSVRFEGVLEEWSQ